MTNPNNCLVCELRPEDTFHIASSEDGLAVALWDPYPVSEGSFLVAPTRHIKTPFEMSPSESASLYGLSKTIAAMVDAEHGPAGYNIGFNVGEQAGQLITHANCLFIPRYEGDVENPRGGVRWIIPEKADYVGNNQAEERQGDAPTDPSLTGQSVEVVHLLPPDKAE